MALFLKKRAYAQKNASKNREAVWKTLYGIILTVPQYQALLELQEGRCAICGTTKPSRGTRFKNFSADHDHRTGSIRGLLCSDCNHGLGHFRDNPDLLIEAARYLGGPSYRKS